MLTPLLVYGLAGLLWLGPSLLSAWLARGATGPVRSTFLWMAAVAALPFIAFEAWALVEAVSTYDGFCRHAPDLRYPCSRLRYAFEMLVPWGAFGLFGLVLLGVPAFLFGQLVFFIGRSRVRRRAGAGLRTQ